MDEIIRPVRLDENSADDFWRLRKELFAELEEIHADSDTSILEAATKNYYLAHINRDLFSWGIFQGKELAAIGSLCLFERIPYAENLSGLEGYILSIYTVPSFRRRGYADHILDAIIGYASQNEIKRLWLNASDPGKLLYARRGFTEKRNEMERFIP